MFTTRFEAWVRLDAAQLSVRSLSRLHPRPLLGRGNVPRSGRVLRDLRRAAPALAAPGHGSGARGFVLGELRAGAGPEPRVHMRDGIVRAARTRGGARGRFDLRRGRAGRRRLPARDPDQLDRTPAHPRGLAAGPRPAAGTRARSRDSAGERPTRQALEFREWGTLSRESRGTRERSISFDRSSSPGVSL